MTDPGTKKMTRIPMPRTITYRGPCEEMYGCEIEIPDHDCREHMRHRIESYVETHGLDCGPYERWTEEWWECSICGEHEEDIADAA
jgi:hypothetical protein